MRLASLIAAALVATAPSVAAQTIQAGAQAPEIDAGRWYNADGTTPRLADLRGRAVLLEFWATWCGPCRAAWPHLKEIEREWSERGLVVLALTDEIPEIVEPYLASTKLDLAVGVASTTRQRYGINQYPTSVLIAPDGRVSWVGHPQGLTSDVLLHALVGVDPAGLGPLALKDTGALTGRAGEAAAAAAHGELGAALAAIAGALAADAAQAPSGAERADLEALRARIEQHVAELVGRARRLAAQRELVPALELARALCDELGQQPLAVDACALAKQLDLDPDARREVEAKRLLDEALEVARKRGIGRARGLLEAVVRDYPGTGAAAVARGRLSAG